MDVTEPDAISGSLDDVVCRLTGERRSETKSRDRSSGHASHRLMVRSTSWVTGCSTLSPFLSRVTQRRDCRRSICSRAGRSSPRPETRVGASSDREVIADLVPSLPGCGEEPIDVRLAEVVPTALLGVCGSVVAILTTPLVDHGSVAPRFGRRPNHERGGYDASEAKFWKWLQGFALRDGAPCGAMPSYVVRKRRSGSPSAGRDRAEEPLIEKLV